MRRAGETMTPAQHPTVWPALHYDDTATAFRFLVGAFSNPTIGPARTEHRALITVTGGPSFSSQRAMRREEQS